MTLHTTISRPLVQVFNRRPVLVSAASAAFGAAVTVAVVVGWSSIGSGDTAPAPGGSAAAHVSAQPNYPASREGVRGHVALDTMETSAAVSSSKQPNYPASREGVRGHVALDTMETSAAVSSSKQPNYPANREGVRGHVALE